MNNTNFTVCTYNIGNGPGDYYGVRKFLDHTISIKTEDDQNEFIKLYNEIQENFAKSIDEADIYLLQEVGSEDRPLIKTLMNNHFQIVHQKDASKFDTAIAISPKRFKNIQNYSKLIHIADSFFIDASIVLANEIKTDLYCTFVSAHVPGFDFTKKVISEADTADGDIYCKKILGELKHLSKNDVTVIGADMNGNPRKCSSRFKTFYDQKFILNKSDRATNINHRDSTEQLREIDFIFTKTSSHSQNGDKINLSTTIKNLNQFSWNPYLQPSDHRTVTADIAITLQKHVNLFDVFRSIGTSNNNNNI